MTLFNVRDVEITSYQSYLNPPVPSETLEVNKFQVNKFQVNKSAANYKNFDNYWISRRTKGVEPLYERLFEALSN